MSTMQITAAPLHAPGPSAVGAPSLFHLILLVWGDEYTKLFTDIGLPALLSDGNIPALARSFPTVFKIYTRPQDVPSIMASAAYRRLAPLVETQFLDFDPTRSGDKYAAMTACHRLALQEAAEKHAAVVFLAPDTIWADGSLATVARAAMAGKRAVMQGGLRVMRDTALPALSRFYVEGATGVASVPPRALVRVALDHMSADFAAWFWDSPDFSRNPANVYWRVADEGLIARCFHLHPLMLFPERKVADFISTLDDDLALLAIPRYESIHVVEDSDEIFHIDLFDGDARAGLNVLASGPTPHYLAEWALQCANLHHRRFVHHRLRWHTGPVTAAWKNVEAASDRVVGHVTLRLRLREIALRAGGAACGIRWPALLASAAATRIGWNLLPPPPAWYRAVAATFTVCGWVRPVAAMETGRRALFAATTEWVFGAGVAARALNGFTSTRLRRERRRRERRRRIERSSLTVMARAAVAIARGDAPGPAWDAQRARAAKRLAKLRKRVWRAYERSTIRMSLRRAPRASRSIRDGVRRTVLVSRSRTAKHLKRDARTARKALRRTLMQGRRRGSSAVVRSRRYLGRGIRWLIRRVRSGRTCEQ